LKDKQMPFADLGELKAHYALSGEGETVLVLSNSLGTDFSMWNPQLPDLEKRFRILRYDMRGHGKSSVTPADYTIVQLGRDVLGLLDALHIERAHFCGLSMGGAIGIWLGIHAPDRIYRLVVCNTAARIGSKEMWNARIATVRKDGMKPVAAAVIERWFTPGFRAAFPDKVALAQRMLENTSPEGYAACCAAVRDMDQREEVSQIKVPTLVIFGASDRVIPLTDAHFLTQQIKGAEEVELAAAHLSNVEQAEGFTQAVRNFLLK
jgi:3-oxoadipate enol-lactonase